MDFSTLATLLVIILPFAVCWLVVRIIRHAWTGR